MSTVLLAHPSPDLYGSDRVFLETVSGFVAAGDRAVVALPEAGPLADALAEQGAEVVFLPFPVLRKSFLSATGLARLTASALRSLPVMVRLIRWLSADLVVVNTITIPLWIAAARLTGRPVACHVHEAERGGRSAVWRTLYAPLLLCTRLIANSRFTLDTITSTWPSLGKRARIVHNGVPGPAHPTSPRPQLTGETRLLFVGRLSPRKGPQIAIEALAQLAASGFPARLQLLGSPFSGYEWFEDELREQVERLGIASSVEFLGFDIDIWGHIASADIVLTPSMLDESFGNTAVEALLAERALVVSTISGLVEATEGYANVRRVPPGDAAALADAIRDLAASWPRVVESSASDRTRALGRHGEGAYRRNIVSAIVPGTR